MSRKVKVLKGGPLSTIQDKGRFNYQQFGMPVAGVMDYYAFRVANILAGNNEKEAVIETTFPGLKLLFTDSCLVAITGADLGAKINGEYVSPWASYQLKAGDQLEFTNSIKGIRAYLAFNGGINIPEVLNSKSTYLRGKIGGYKGRPLKEGDVLEINKPEKEFTSCKVPENFIPKVSQEEEIRVILGPQDDYFSEEEIKKFLTNNYTITMDSDRMGYRLEGVKLKHLKGADIISDGIIFGSIQVPGEGLPIIMMADHQTTGGYPKIANVISVDLPKLAQMKPGQKISFKKVSIEYAHHLLKEQELHFQKLKEFVENINSGRRFIIRINEKVYDVQVQEIN